MRNIVPHTASETTLSGFQIGREVNIETDMIGKVRGKNGPGVGKGTLERAGSKTNIDFDFRKKTRFHAHRKNL